MTMQIGRFPELDGFKHVEVTFEGVTVKTATAGERIWNGDLLTIVDGVATRGVKSLDETALVAAERAEKGSQFTYYQPGLAVYG